MPTTVAEQEALIANCNADLSNYLCGICFGLFAKPKFTCSSGHTHCEECLRTLYASELPNHDKCPTCRKPIILDDAGQAGVHNTFVQQVMDVLPTTCPKECGKHFMMAKWPEHKLQCPNVAVKCPFGCGDVLRGELAAHMEDNVVKHTGLSHELLAATAANTEKTEKKVRGLKIEVLTVKDLHRDQVAAMQRQMRTQAAQHAELMAAIHSLSARVAEGELVSRRVNNELNCIFVDFSHLDTSKRGREAFCDNLRKRRDAWQSAAVAPATPEPIRPRKLRVPGAPRRDGLPSEDTQDSDDDALELDEVYSGASDSPPYRPTSPSYTPTSPSYSPTSPYRPTSPSYSPTSPHSP